MTAADNSYRDIVLNSGKHLWIATDILRELGQRNVTTKSPGYRRACRVLRSLAAEGFLHGRYFPEVNLTVYWKIP